MREMRDNSEGGGEDANQAQQPSNTGDSKAPNVCDGIVDQLATWEDNVRQYIEDFLMQKKIGRMINQITAVIAGASTVIYVSITYLDNYATIMASWYMQMELIVTMAVLVLYLLTWYSKADRISFLTTSESLLTLVVILPILLLKDVTMKNQDFFVLIALSRYSRLVYFFVVILNYHELGSNEVDCQVKKVSLTMVLVVVMSAGLFGEVENSLNWSSYDEIPCKGSGIWQLKFPADYT